MEFTDTVSLDMSKVVPTISGPKRPQDKVLLTEASSNFKKVFENVTKRKSPIISKIESQTKIETNPLRILDSKNEKDIQINSDAPIIEKVYSDDNRSYQINSDKIYKVLGYRPMRSLEEAVSDLCKAFKDGKLPNSLVDDKYMNVKVMKNKNVK